MHFENNQTMTYKELSRREERTVFTTVEFIFDDGTKREVEVPHLNPKDEADITLGLENRMMTESQIKSE